MTIEQLKTAIETKYTMSDKALVAGDSELAEAFEQQAMDLAHELARKLDCSCSRGGCALFCEHKAG